MNKFFQVKMGGVACALVMMAISQVQAQVGALVVENKTPVLDILQRPLPGTWKFPDESCRVEIRQTTPAGVILPPDPATGAGNPLNPLVRSSYMGMGVIGNNPGRFSEAFTNRLSTNSTYFVRVYTAPLPSNAIYYADSAVFVAPADANVTLVDVIFQPKLFRLVATGAEDVDSDGDGIPDAMEGDMGLDAGNPDTDGDGYPDGFEAIHGAYLQPTEPDPSLEIQINPPFALAVDPHTVSWQTIPVPNMEYRLEYRPQWTDETAYDEVWNGMATDTNLEIDVEGLVTNVLGKGFFRVTVPYTIP